VSSLTREAGRSITVADVLPYAEKHLDDVLSRP
jgi:lipoyl(octanoyl) transferase